MTSHWLHTRDKRICKCPECTARRSDSSKRAIQTRDVKDAAKKAEAKSLAEYNKNLRQEQDDDFEESEY